MTEGKDVKIQINYKNLGIIVAFVIILSGILLTLMLFWGRKGIPQKESNNQIMETKEEVKIEDLKVGGGSEAKNGNKLTVNYLGTLDDGTKFDSSYDRKEPFSFTLGEGRVIPGWEMGLVGMKEGGKRKLTIPSSLGYGQSGSGPIPPNATLIFEIELLKVE